jgi:putative DNA primase/helicase
MITIDDFLKKTEKFKQTPSGTSSGNEKDQDVYHGFDVAEYLRSHNIPFTIKRSSDAGTLFCLDTCLFNAGHGKDAAIIQRPSGKLIYKCFHDSCKDKTWDDARKVISGDESLNTAPDVVGPNGKVLHLEVAKAIVAQYGQENLTYVSDLQIFRIWNGHVWLELDDQVIKRAVIKYLDGRTSGITKNVVASVFDLIRTLAFKDDIIWDTDTGVIPVLNGELAWNGIQWTLTPHIREHYRTTLIPVEYDPEARAPRFEQFLSEIFQCDLDAVEKSILICEMIGYTLTTTCIYEKFILLIGVGANGKSVLLEVIRLLIGPNQVAAVQPDQMDNRFQRAHLCGKLANIVTEIKEGGEVADAALKSIASGELTTAEHKFKKPFDFQPFATCWFGTNHMPHTRDFSEALFRRALIVEFNHVFQEHEQDKHLKRKLAAELPGILNLALNAFAGVIEHRQFTIPESCIRAKEEWRREADQVAQFINDCCLIAPEASVPSGTLYNAYRHWAANAGIQRMLNRINFSKRMQRLGGKLDRTANSRLIYGIRLASTSEENE